MSQMYKLNLGNSYATLKKVFRAGEVFSAEDLGDEVNALNEAGVPYFVTTDEAKPELVVEEVVEAKKPATHAKPKGPANVTIGKKAPVQAEPEAPTEVGGITL